MGTEAKSKFAELIQILSQQIEQGAWLPGEKLPAIRPLVAQTGYSKNTVLRALAELQASGVIESKSRRGFFVSNRQQGPKTPALKSVRLQPSEVNLPSLFHHIMARGAAFDLTPSASNKYQTKALTELNKAINRAQKRQSSDKAFYYDAPMGEPQLKQEIRERYKLRETHLNADQICITAGCQNALFLALSVCCAPGDSVAVESPGFYGALQLLEQLKLNVVEIPSSPSTGLDLDQLEVALSKIKIKACIVTPNFATPTGALMPDANKVRLITLANTYDLTLIEDDIYGELAFTQDVKPLLAYDSQDRVVLCSSFSKSLSRDLRLGWIVSARWQQDIQRLKLSTQLASPKGIQEGVSNFIRHGHYRRHLTHFRRNLIDHRNQLVSAMFQYWPFDVNYSLPQGGLALWVELPECVDGNALYRQLLETGIVLTPGSLFSFGDRYRNCLRMSFNHPIQGERLEAVKLLGKYIERIA